MRKRARMGSFSLGGTCWLIAAVLSFECVKICSAVVCREDVWAVNAEKRYRLPKTKSVGSQIQARKKPINCLTDTEKCVMVITVSIFMT